MWRSSWRNEGGIDMENVLRFVRGETGAFGGFGHQTQSQPPPGIGPSSTMENYRLLKKSGFTRADAVRLANELGPEWWIAEDVYAFNVQRYITLQGQPPGEMRAAPAMRR